MKKIIAKRTYTEGFTLVFKMVKRTCMTCKKEYEDTTGCVLCSDCQQRNAFINRILGK